jgi:hypothetical protein
VCYSSHCYSSVLQYRCGDGRRLQRKSWRPCARSVPVGDARYNRYGTHACVPSLPHVSPSWSKNYRCNVVVLALGAAAPDSRYREGIAAQASIQSLLLFEARWKRADVETPATLPLFIYTKRRFNT